MFFCCKVSDNRRFIYSKIENEKSIKRDMKPKIDSIYLENYHLKSWKYGIIGRNDNNQIFIETRLKKDKEAGIDITADTNLTIINIVYLLAPVY